MLTATHLPLMFPGVNTSFKTFAGKAWAFTGKLIAAADQMIRFDCIGNPLVSHVSFSTASRLTETLHKRTTSKRPTESQPPRTDGRVRSAGFNMFRPVCRATSVTAVWLWRCFCSSLAGRLIQSIESWAAEILANGVMPYFWSLHVVLQHSALAVGFRRGHQGLSNPKLDIYLHIYKYCWTI